MGRSFGVTGDFFRSSPRRREEPRAVGGAGDKCRGGPLPQASGVQHRPVAGQEAPVARRNEHTVLMCSGYRENPRGSRTVRGGPGRAGPGRAVPPAIGLLRPHGGGAGAGPAGSGAAQLPGVIPGPETERGREKERKKAERRKGERKKERKNRKKRKKNPWGGGGQGGKYRLDSKNGGSLRALCCLASPGTANFIRVM